MASVEYEAKAQAEAKSQERIRIFPDALRHSSHVTVGTANSKILPAKVGILVRKWRLRGAALGVGDSFGNGGALNVIELPGHGITVLAKVKGL